MVLRLDPAVPLVWRTPQCIQFGIDTPIVTIDDIAPVTERMISALVTGVSVSGLEMIARSATGAPSESRALIARLSPVLEQRIIPDGGNVTVWGTGRAAVLLTQHLTTAGITIVPDGPRTALTVIVADFVIDPELHGRWLRRDIPHLPIVFGDEKVRVGPLVDPGNGPCLYCLERHRTDSDPAWPAIASQLWGRRSPIHESTAGTLVEQEVAASAARLVLERLRPRRRDHPRALLTSIEIEAVSGMRSSRRVTVHPDCLCRSLTGEPSIELRAVLAEKHENDEH